MAVNTLVVLPAQPAQGSTVYTPLGGDGRSAPHGCYFVLAEIDGDASSGNASVTIDLDVRYTSLVAYANLRIQADAAAGDFRIAMQADPAVAIPPTPSITGTIPHVATAVTPDNASFLWYPPGVFFQGGARINAVAPNVGALETYKLELEVLVFDIDVRRITPMPWLMLNVPGVSAPAAI